MAALLLLLLALRPAGAAPSAPARILFNSDRGGDWEIYSMNADGGNVVNLTNSPTTDDERPAAAPDGRIAFARTQAGNTDSWIMNADGSGQTRLTTHTAIDNGPAWSPDGARILFRSDRDGNPNIYVMDADGDNQTALTTDPARDHGPDWSPDGNRVVFASDRAGNDDVYVMAADGSDVAQLTTDPAGEYGAAWSPDGALIAFRSERDDDGEIYVMAPDGSGQTPLTSHPATDRGPSWSPDGGRIAFFSDRDGNYEIYTMNAAGGDVVRLTEHPKRDYLPEWTTAGDEPACFTLSRAHTGQGGNPAPDPAGSDGCPAGQYVAGALIALTAAPADGWHVAGWSGTDDDGSTATTNSLTMPAADHTVTVAYEPDDTPECHTLTRAHNGQGGDPAADPANSPGCPAGQYVAEAVIALTADPDDGWHVSGWTGADATGPVLTNSLTMPAGPHTVTVIYEPDVTVDCYDLTLGHSGQGDDPTATPNKSTGCTAGRYVAGQAISLSANPANGWKVGGWSGTANDGSTATSNSLTMPAADHAASVTYIEDTATTCYRLTLKRTGQGAMPAAAPNKSPGCGNGKYVAGTLITLTADPARGWHVAGWSGTDDDGSPAETNTLLMPAAAHTAGVIYVEDDTVVCYQLSLTHTGQGTNPTAAPANSAGCAAGRYVAGAAISLTALPAAGWRVAGWGGTADDAATTLTNSLTMPAAAHTVSVHYEPPVCYLLTLSHSGQGADPTAAPAFSTGCGTGRYVAGQVIALTAAPGSGQLILGWGGTANDSSTAPTNSLTMPAADHAASVHYGAEEPCYALRVSHAGQGSNPLYAPSASAGCTAGHYHAGQVIALSAAPALGWEVAGWAGTSDDASTATANLAVMPAADHAVVVTYRLSPERNERVWVPVVTGGG